MKTRTLYGVKMTELECMKFSKWLHNYGVAPNTLKAEDRKKQAEQWLIDNNLHQIDLESVQSENFEEAGENPCIICGKSIDKPTNYIHLTTDGNLTRFEEHTESQGLFPVGHGCVRKIEAPFVFN